MTKRRTVIVRYSDCCKRTIIEEIEKKGLKKEFYLSKEQETFGDMDICKNS